MPHRPARRRRSLEAPAFCSWSRVSPSPRPVFVLASLALAFGGCSLGPRYQTVARFIPPADTACVARFDEAAARCRADCATRYQQCRAGLAEEAKARHHAALRDYEVRLAAHRAELARYRLDLWLWSTQPSHWPGPWLPPPPPPPPPPPMPRLDAEWDRLAQSRCGQDCGCASAFEGCFLACGGRIEHEKRCVAGCGG